MAAKINCPYCGKLTDPELDNCPHCGGPMRGGAPESRGAGGRHHCPGCGAPVQDGDIVCVSCGTNLITGQKVTDERRDAVVRNRSFQPLLIVGSIAVVAIVVLGAVFYVLSRDPVKKALKLSQNNRNLDAINVLLAHVDKKADDARAQFLLGKLYWQSGQLVPAAKAFDAAHVVDPANREAGMLAALAYSKQPGDGGRNGELSALKRLVEQSPDDTQSQYLYALALGDAGDYDAEREHLEKVLSIDPDNALARRSLGIALALRGDYPAAAESLQMALRADQGDRADTETVLGLVANMQGDSAAGEAHLLEAIEGEAGTVSLAQARLGLLYMARGDYDNALPQLREAKRSGDTSPTTRFFHALCLERAGLDREALDSYAQLVDEGQGRYAAEAAVQMAQIYLAQGNDTKAREAIRSATQLGGASARLYTVQGLLQIEDNELGEAQESFRKAMREDGDYGPAYLESGLLRIRRGLVSEGLRELERYLEIAGDTTAGRTEEIRVLVEQLRQTVAG